MNFSTDQILISCLALALATCGFVIATQGKYIERLLRKIEDANVRIRRLAELLNKGG